MGHEGGVARAVLGVDAALYATDHWEVGLFNLADPDDIDAD